MNRSIKQYGFILSLMLAVGMWMQSDLVYSEPLKQWVQLTPIQQEALQPLALQWNSLPPKLRQHLLLSSEQYSSLSAEKKKRFLSRLEKWSKLTPEQREHARQKYIALRQLSKDKRAAIEKERLYAATLKNSQPASQPTQTDIVSQPAIVNNL